MPQRTIKKSTTPKSALAQEGLKVIEIAKPAAKAKKAAPKHVAKKTAPVAVKNVVKQSARDEECFWINNGPIVRTVSELKSAVSKMSNEQYAHHTKRGSNDFANWLEMTMCRPKCAAKMRSAKTKAAAVKCLGTCDE